MVSRHSTRLLIGALLPCALAVSGMAGCGGGDSQSPENGKPNTYSESDAGKGAADKEMPRPLSNDDLVDLKKLIAKMPNRQGLAIIGSSPVAQSVGELRSATAWSTAKVPVVMASKRLGVGSADDRNLAITISNNGAAKRLWNELGDPDEAAASADAELRASGDDRTRIQSTDFPETKGYLTFGQTDWSLASQARFVAGMSCTSEGRSTLGLMAQVTAGGDYGLPVAFPGARIKGGWGPGTTPGQTDAQGYSNRQMGVVEAGGKKAAVAIIAAGGSEDENEQQLTELAAWLKSRVNGSNLTGSLYRNCR